MIVEDQSETIAFLASPQCHGGVRVERIDTHCSVVFLAGDTAYKLKRAVRFPYLDYGTAERRREMCESEVALNRRTAPEIYRGTAPVTREPDGRLALGGVGRPVDWVVVMARFDEDSLLDRMAGRGALDEQLMERLAEEIARFHAAADRGPEHGGRAGMARVIESNARAFANMLRKSLGWGTLSGKH